MTGISGYLPELYMGLSSLLVHKLRSMLTMLGMIFGVGAVVAMLSITAGAQKEMISYIDLLGVNNIIVEAKEAVDANELQARPRDFAGPHVPRLSRHLRERSGPGGYHAAQAIQAAESSSQDQPGTAPADRRAAELREDQQPQTGGRALLQRGRERASAPVCVLGETAKVNLLGFDDAIGKYVKVNDLWLQVIGVLAPQATADSDQEGMESANRNNMIISPLNTVMRRFEDNTSYLKDEIDGIYMKVARGNRFDRDLQRRERDSGSHA